MEFNRVEEAAVQEVAPLAANDQVLELADAQLLIVGGGVGEVGLN